MTTIRSFPVILGAWIQFLPALDPSAAVDPAPVGSSSALRFKLGAATLTVRECAEASATAAVILLEQAR